MRDSSPRALRKFGLTVGGVFLLLGGVSWWRGHEIAPRIMWDMGGPLVVLGLVAPRLLDPVERAWMAMAEVMGRVNARIILTTIYYLVVTPIGVLRRRSADPLTRRMHDGTPSNWVKRERVPVDPARYRHQF
jgi:hypothetical protein